jgi:hypothetical protein
MGRILTVTIDCQSAVGIFPRYAGGAAIVTICLAATIASLARMAFGYLTYCRLSVDLSIEVIIR